MKAALVCGVGVLAFGVIARADAPFVAEAEGSRVSIDAVWSPMTQGQVGAMNVSGQLQLTSHLVVDLDVPWAVGTLTGEALPNAGLGNITPGLHGIWHPRPNLVLSFGATASIPTTYRIGATNDALGTASVLTLAAETAGAHDVYLFLPEFFTLRTPFELEVRFASIWRYRLVVMAAWTAAVGSDVATPYGIATAVYGGVWVASSSTFEVHLPRQFLIGLRTEFVGMEPLVYYASLSEELLVGYEPDAGPFVRVGGFVGNFELNLSTALRASVGWRF